MKTTIELVKKYKQYEENLENNIKFFMNQMEEYKKSFYNEKIVEGVIKSNTETIIAFKGQLAVIREIVADLDDKMDEYYNKDLNYKLGEILN